MPVRSIRRAHSVQAIRFLGLQGSSSSDSLGELFQHFHGRVPVDTCICDADTLLETRWPLRGDLLVALGKIGLNHHAHNTCLSFPDLIANHLRDLGLVAVILVGIACAGSAVVHKNGSCVSYRASNPPS